MELINDFKALWEMRTTLNLDDTIAQRLKKYARKRRTSIKAAANEALSRGLEDMNSDSKSRPYKTKAKHLGMRGEINPRKLKHYADEEEDTHKVKGTAHGNRR